jgi:hypothetical protein
MAHRNAVIIEDFANIVVMGTVLLNITRNFMNNDILDDRCGNRTHLLSRHRRTVYSIFYELGDHNARRAYRMWPKSFWKLAQLLEPRLMKQIDRRTPNGTITHWIRLSIAFRYLAGGQPIDIALVHGVSHSIVFPCLWQVIDAINETKELDIVFPSCHEQQQQMANDFKSKSTAGFDNCVGAVDGILIWILKPTKADCARTHFGPKKYFCGRKKKFGLNMQGTCDAKRRFTDVSICHPGATSDYLAFESSTLKYKLHQQGFLLDSLCVYGDNAYVNTPHVATPFKNVSNGPKDAYNFFHSQLRINIECAFGMLVHRFAILRKPIPQNISLKKTSAMVLACCKLHNYCIDENEITVPNQTGRDAVNISTDGGIRISEETDFIPSDLLGAGDRNPDYNRNDTRQRIATETIFPREYLLNMVIQKNLIRPTPITWIRNVSS